MRIGWCYLGDMFMGCNTQGSSANSKLNPNILPQKIAMGMGEVRGWILSDPDSFGKIPSDDEGEEALFTPFHTFPLQCDISAFHIKGCLVIHWPEGRFTAACDAIHG